MRRLVVTAGRGPAECRLALARVLDRMEAEAEASATALDVVRGRAPDRHGPGSALVFVDGPGEAAFAATWCGTVLWTAKSRLRPGHGRKNWYVGVFEQAPPAAPAALAAADVVFEALRAGGPGGQHQNTTASAVRAVHRPSGLTVLVRDERSQHRNRAIALERLARMVRGAADLAARSDRAVIGARHDQIERGRPIRRFAGEGFDPVE